MGYYSISLHIGKKCTNNPNIYEETKRINDGVILKWT